jgi:predicted DNA-binding protein (MmcQ/YjbR family)
MHYYSEEDMKDLRLALESEVLCWDRVSFTKMFGCPCYKVNEKLFVFLVTKGIVFTHLNKADRAELASLHQTTSFRAGSRNIKNWLQVSVDSVKEIEDLVPFLRKSYQEIRKQTD